MFILFGLQLLNKEIYVGHSDKFEHKFVEVPEYSV